MDGCRKGGEGGGVVVVGEEGGVWVINNCGKSINGQDSPPDADYIPASLAGQLAVLPLSLFGSPPYLYIWFLGWCFERGLAVVINSWQLHEASVSYIAQSWCQLYCTKLV